MIAPGGHPRFVLSAATLKDSGSGEGSVNDAPTCRPRSAASAFDTTAQPLSRSLPFADVRSPATSSLGGISCELSAGGARIQSLRSPHVRKLPRYTLTRWTPRRRRRPADPAYIKGVVANALDSPRGVTHTSVLESMPCAEASRPR